MYLDIPSGSYFLLLLDPFGTHWSGVTRVPGLKFTFSGRCFSHFSHPVFGLHLGQWQCGLNNEMFSYEVIPFTIKFQ